MFYALIGALALILNLIINRESLKGLKGRTFESESEQKVISRYRTFLIASNCYFVADIAWGLLYENHHIDALFPVLYFDCLLYFFFMFLSILTWIRYIVAYLDRHDRKSKVILQAVWIMFDLAIVYLIINYFHPFIFSFDENHEYIVEPGRHIAFILQIILYLVTSTYLLFIAHKSTGGDKSRYAAVGLVCLVMEIFLIFQIFDDSYPSYAGGLIIGICVIHSFVEASERKDKEIYDNIATTLAENYEAMYYIDIDTGEFLEFSTSQLYESMNVPVAGRNFYKETLPNIEKYVHPDDREFARNMHQKEIMMKNLEGKRSYSYKYRLMIDGNQKYFQFTVMLAPDGKHFILGEKDIDDEITIQNMKLENQKKQVTFTQIAEILAVNYDVIYYVDIKDASYISYECRNIYGEVDVQRTGEDFFEDSKIDISNIVHKNDRDLALDFVNKHHLISALTDKKSCSIEYRIVAFRKTHYVRMSVQKTTDGSHYIIGIENIDDEIRKEKQHLKALNTEKELARRDELTGVKNKTAYTELEKSVQSNIDNGMDYLPFGLVVCDTNNLKKINDSKGHTVGDEYIKKSAMLLCNTFVHSPVFRVGGDEFIVFLRGNDYANKDELMNNLRAKVHENLHSKTEPVLASGFAEFVPGKDLLVSEIFERADKDMYKNKRELKKKEASL